MLDYEWSSASPVMLAGEEDSVQDPDHGRQFLDHYSAPTGFNDGLFAGAFAHPHPHHHHHHHHHQPPQQPHFHHPFYDPRSAYYGPASASYPPPAPHPMLGYDAVASADEGHGPAAGFMVVPKVEEDVPQQQPAAAAAALDFTSRLGLNLGRRTYFSAADEDFVNRVYRRSGMRPVVGDGGGLVSARCQVEGCGVDLTHAKHYHRRHKVCEYHSKAATVVAAGLTQRFCQQCSRFHLLSEFDNGKRSCRKRLADHNRRRRKCHQTSNQDHHKSQPQLESAGRNSSSESFARSPSESGGQYSSSVTVAISPPRMSLDCFRGRHYQAAASSSASSSSSIFFSSGG